MAAKAGIYRIYCTKNGKSYVGQSKNADSRVEEHFYRLSREEHQNCHLQSAYSLYGLGCFKSEILEYCLPELLTEREQFWMDFYRPTGLYNLAPAAGSPLGYKHTEEARRNMSNAKIGNKNAVNLRGHKRSEQVRLNMSKAAKERWARKRGESSPQEEEFS